MNIKTPKELYEKLMSFTDEAEARNFLTEHINEFPEDLKQKVILAFFTEALDKKADMISQKIKLQESGLKAVGEIETIEKDLKNQKNIIDVMADLQK